MEKIKMKKYKGNCPADKRTRVFFERVRVFAANLECVSRLAAILFRTGFENFLQNA